MTLISTLIAEDDSKNAELLNRFIGRLEGFNIVGVSQSFVQAIDMVDVMRPDLILLDNHFPDGSGTELLQKMRKKGIQTDVIMITAAQDVSTIRSALHGGVFDYIIKPIAYQRLEDSLKKFQDYFLQLHNTKKMKQRDVDKLLQREQHSMPEPPERLPKGIDLLTLNKIRQQFSEDDGPFTAEQMGQSLGLSRTTARRYLEYLVSLNEIQADVNYGSVGRPERLYKKLV
ncbi:MAG: response regulator [Arenicella sp.]